ncbi:hypothetical protein C463_06537 [Halorubrum californiense DSM 19288]|uniref:Uncharacterized protein n=1 Tax=Halorubrum californiense DSM 19288 TaxID=1227465 RepID=M0EED7_9EURY|nr:MULTISPECIES: hypothetical protein [Halorubrum]ELZ45257.1 hypothetical protein C463_06537 [Halorubrum californiense DSM 19288]TKX72113.1 hypothetical protein EXE40_05495 [Halorubrum sp. GN11GM_10-3_MGM]
MSRSDRGPWEISGGAPLEPDIGPVDDVDCGSGHCDRDAVYRVAWPNFGGDEALCEWHLCRFRHQHTEIWDQMRALDAPNPDTFAVRGQRFISLDEVPEEIAVDDDRMRRVALGDDGLALFESADVGPGDPVRFVTVDRRLDVDGSIEVARGKAGSVVAWYRDHEGVYEWDPEAKAALHGGESAR